MDQYLAGLKRKHGLVARATKAIHGRGARATIFFWKTRAGRPCHYFES